MSETIIQAFPPERRADAKAFADQIGGKVIIDYNEYGWVAVGLADPDGKHVPRWNSIDVPEGFVLRPRGSVKVGDEVISSHSGRQTVRKALLFGDVGHGAVYLTVGANQTEAYPSSSYIPVKAAVDDGTVKAPQVIETYAVEYQVFYRPTNSRVGAVRKDFAAAESVFEKWRMRGSDVVLRSRKVSPWEDVIA